VILGPAAIRVMNTQEAPEAPAQAAKRGQ
jgi:hypothetical protein